jgi:hypothetical protein
MEALLRYAPQAFLLLKASSTSYKRLLPHFPPYSTLFPSPGPFWDASEVEAVRRSEGREGEREEEEREGVMKSSKAFGAAARKARVG